MRRILVILNEVKNLRDICGEILHFVQNDSLKSSLIFSQNKYHSCYREHNS